MKVLVINCGSSSIKYQLFEMPEGKVLAKGLLEKIGERESNLKVLMEKEKIEIKKSVSNHEEGMGLILEVLTDKERGVLKDIREIEAVGHRVVHGGEHFKESTIIDEDVLNIIEDYTDLAPLHNPPNLIGIKVAVNALPDIPHIAVFDTAFHQTIPEYAYLYAIMCVQIKTLKKPSLIHIMGYNKTLTHADSVGKYGGLGYGSLSYTIRANVATVFEI